MPKTKVIKSSKSKKLEDNVKLYPLKQVRKDGSVKVSYAKYIKKMASEKAKLKKEIATILKELDYENLKHIHNQLVEMRDTTLENDSESDESPAESDDE